MLSTASLNSVYQIGVHNVSMNKLLEQVSTGNRINSAADDAAGMSIADSLRMQANSLAQGTRNANDAKSLLDIADKAIISFKDTIGLMKEKAIAAASDASSPLSRQALQKDVVAFLKSLDNVANTTSYNGMKLLNGTFANKQFQVGAYANQTVQMTLGSLNTNKIGHLTESETTTGVSAGTTAATLAINGSTVQQVTVSGTGKDGANLLADSINLLETVTGVSAKATNSVSGGSVVGGSIADGDIKINGISIGAVNFNANDNTGALAEAINGVSAQTGVSARVDAGSLVLTSANGENIHITEANAGAAKAGLTAGTNYGKVTLSSSSAISIANGDAVSGLNALTTTNFTLSDIDVRDQDGAQRAMKIIDYALNEANKNSSDVGAVTNQLDRMINVNSVTETNVRAAEDTIRGANVEELSKNLMELQVKSQAALFALTKANETQQSVLTLLR